MAIVLISGANRGIGARITHHLAAAGHTVFAGTRNPDAVTELDCDAGDIRVVPLDVTIDESVGRAVATINEAAGRLDVLINNAGVAWFAAAEEMSDQMLRLTMETNFFGAVRCARAVLPLMRHQRSGHIITISSIAAAVGLPLESAYCASKSAIEAFSESLRHEAARFGVNVSVIEPGITEGGLSTSVADPHASSSTTYRDLLAHTFDFYEAAQSTVESPTLVCNAIDDLLDDPTPPFRIALGQYAQLIHQLNAANDADASAMVREALDIAWWHAGNARPQP